MKTLALAPFVVLAFTVPGYGQTYSHNGSAVDVKLEGAVVTIEYRNPSKGAYAVGAVPGTKIFEGAISRRTDHISGLAFHLAGFCGAHPYQAAGRFGNSEDILVLQGAPPVVNPRTCRVTGYRASSDLTFTIDRSTRN
jgi:hypothetical protein